MSRTAAVLLVLALGACVAPGPQQRRGPPPGEPRARLFISPAGEPFRGQDAMRAWFDQADADHDGTITAAEFEADHLRFFRRLDADGDAMVSNPEVQRYEREIAPEILSRIDRGEGGAAARGGFAGGRSGAGRSGGGRAVRGGRNAGPRGGGPAPGLTGDPEPVLAADTDLDFQVSLAEWRAAAARRFARLDLDHDGRLRFDELKRPQGVQRTPRAR